MQSNSLDRETMTMDWNGTQAALQLNVSSINGTMDTAPTDVFHNSSLVKVATSSSWYNAGKVQIPLYSIIFVLSVIGNTLVILTLVQNHRMRTVTNVFLLNLAISDLMLGVLCMPFTLTGALLRNFIFGEIMCKMLPFLQACSVSVGVWTLVAISVERYYAICHPLRSLRWQTLGHAYRLIAAIWMGSFVCMSPIAALSQLQPTRQGKQKCRENWSSLDYERAYNLFLDAILLVIPLLVLAVTYSMITKKLCKGMRVERQGENDAVNLYVNQQGRASTRRSTIRSFTCDHYRHSSRLRLHHNGSSDSNSPPSTKRATPLLRRSNAERSLNNKKRVVKMLLAVVLEFFVCWTPLYVINTLALFNPQIVYSTVGYSGVGFFQLLAYTSSCCNPITYCFMNSSFKKAFLNLFRCFKKISGSGNYALTSSGMHMESKSSNNRASE